MISPFFWKSYLEFRKRRIDSKWAWSLRAFDIFTQPFSISVFSRRWTWNYIMNDGFLLNVHLQWLTKKWRILGSTKFSKMRHFSDASLFGRCFLGDFCSQNSLILRVGCTLLTDVWRTKLTHSIKQIFNCYVWDEIFSKSKTLNEKEKNKFCEWINFWIRFSQRLPTRYIQYNGLN